MYTFSKAIITPISYSTAVEELLTACDLPVSDLRVGTPVHLFGVQHEGALAGVVGLEQYGRVALLRSLAVDEAVRTRGIGQDLVAYAEAWAAQAGVQEVYLLTTTASAFFARLGYEAVPRSAAPAAIAQTSQFADLCPSSSPFMRKVLA